MTNKKKQIIHRPLSKSEKENLERTAKLLYPDRIYGDALLQMIKHKLI